MRSRGDTRRGAGWGWSQGEGEEEEGWLEGWWPPELLRAGPCNKPPVFPELGSYRAAIKIVIFASLHSNILNLQQVFLSSFSALA